MLRDIQTRFYQATLAADDDPAMLGQLLVGDVVTRSRRFAAYRRNAFGNLTDALKTTYPVVVRIVGDGFFREAARQFILAYPSVSGDLNDYGVEFPVFLAGYPHAQELPYLADVARLEWAIQEILSLPEPRPSDLSLLATLPPERYGELRFQIDPRCRCLDSAWPLATIWQVNQDSYSGDMTVDFTQAEAVLIGLHQGRLSVECLLPAAAAFFAALQDRHGLIAAAEMALACDATFDFGNTLQQWIASGLLHYATLPDYELETP